MRVEVRSKSFGAKHVLDNVRFELERGTVLAIIGPSGCGKTTLLRIIAGLDRAYEGSVEVPQPLAMVFQEPRLLPWRTVEQNVRLVLPPDAPHAEAIERTRRALASVGLGQEGRTFPRALSLGMARRVAFARAAAVGPALLLLDEPFVSLDETTAAQLRKLAASLWREGGMTVVLVTHNLDEAVELADRVLVLDGQPAAVVLDHPLKSSSAVRDAAWCRGHRHIIAHALSRHPSAALAANLLSEL